VTRRLVKVLRLEAPRASDIMARMVRFWDGGRDDCAGSVRCITENEVRIRC
jgi:hypothetical protein